MCSAKLIIPFIAYFSIKNKTTTDHLIDNKKYNWKANDTKINKII